MFWTTCQSTFFYYKLSSFLSTLSFVTQKRSLKETKKIFIEFDEISFIKFDEMLFIKFDEMSFIEFDKILLKFNEISFIKFDDIWWDDVC